jgi:hypothetical protein
LWTTKPDFPIPEKKMVLVEERRVQVKKMVPITTKFSEKNDYCLGIDIEGEKIDELMRRE